jgi:hypothetical protein
LLQPCDERAVNGLVCALAFRASAQDCGIAGLEAKRRRVSGHVGTALVNEANHAERHAHTFDDHAIGPRPALCDCTDGIGQGAHHVETCDHGSDAGLIERETVRESRARAGCPGLGQIQGIGREDVIVLRAQRLRHGGERRVFVLPSRKRQRARCVPCTAAQLAHGLCQFASGFDSFQRRSHDQTPTTPVLALRLQSLPAQRGGWRAKRARGA